MTLIHGGSVVSKSKRDEIMARYKAAADDIDAGLSAEEAQQNLMTRFDLTASEALDVLANLPRYRAHTGGSRDSADQWSGFPLFVFALTLIVVGGLVYAYHWLKPWSPPAIVGEGCVLAGLALLGYRVFTPARYGERNHSPFANWGMWDYFDIWR
jgi:hypothetical protein